MVNRVNKQWNGENKQVSYEEYSKFAEQFANANPVGHEIYAVNQKQFVKMKKYCKANAISINDLLIAKLYTAAHIKKIIIAADVRSYLPNYKKGALGNYASAFGIVCKGKSNDILKKARKVKKQVAIHTSNNHKLMLILSCYLNMKETLIDAAAIAALGDFQSKSAEFVGSLIFGYKKRDGMSITNLGRIKNVHIRRATFLPPASPAMMQTIGVLTVNNQMQLCSSYYENAISKEEVTRMLSILEKE